MGILGNLFGNSLASQGTQQQGLQQAQSGQTYVTTTTSTMAQQLAAIQSYWPYQTVPTTIWEPVITFESLAPLAVTHNPSKTVLFIWEP